ncbi:MAG: DUF2076 family protein [Beijerinckiaceae bacterium]|nr:DUF2076 family protein [Beijerinckiaceae bacterium]
MTPQERELLEGLFARIRAAPAGARDTEADSFITEQVRQIPHAAYLLSQTVIVQEEALKAAAAKIDELNARVADLEDTQQAQPSSFLGGVGKSAFSGAEPTIATGRGSVPSVGGWRSQDQQMPEPSRAGGISMPNVAPAGSRWTQQGRPLAAAQQPQAGGGSFLKGALGAAAGVAGGMLLANSLSGLLKGSDNPLGIADAKAGQKTESSGGATTPASEQDRQPWGGADSREDTSSAEDDGFDGSAFDNDDHDDGDGGWSDDL